jgi:hypothetical protein
MPPLDHLGYQIHTNLELGMMLRREKPLAFFYEIDGNFIPLVRRYMRMFDRHVRLGRFAKREHIEDYVLSGKPPRKLALVFYALSGKNGESTR